MTIVLLQLKSHIKFVALGLFLGIVLAHFAAWEIYAFLSNYVALGPEAVAVSALQLVLVVIPAIMLGFNHYHSRTHTGFAKALILALITSLLAVSSVLEFLPDTTRRLVLLNSFAAGQLSYLRLPILVAAAAAILFDRSNLPHTGKKKNKK